jgi:spore cortex biosynthesis protein YabQ
MTPELQVFLCSLPIGALIMLAWDFLHGIRTVVLKNTAANILLDVLWWGASAFVIIKYTWYLNYMNLRFFIFAALIGGAFLYHITLSEAVRSLFCAFFEIFLKIFKFIFKILLTPALFLYKILFRVVTWICNRKVK